MSPQLARAACSVEGVVPEQGGFATTMACLNTLKLEIKTLEQIFTKSHERFQVLTATVDELTCRFIGHNNRRYDIHANITVGDALCYPLLRLCLCRLICIY